MGVLSRKHGVASSLILGATSLALVSGCGEQGLATAASLSAQAKEVRSTNLTQDEVCLDGDPACTPTGAHGKHGAYLCSVCHKVAGRLVFDKTGPAYATGYPNPTFDATAKTCTNVACHRVPPGTFSYYFGVDGNGDPVLYTVSYGGGPPRSTPSWYATAGCTACHDNPPKNGSDGSNAWHSGFHANRPPTDPYNQCQFCHPDATGSNGVGTSITNPLLHGNGIVNVQATFRTSCFGCH
jgi:hypothetical protein